MTWEELAAFIAALPEDERKRPAWLVSKNRVREIRYDGQNSIYGLGYIRKFYSSDGVIEDGDWVIE